MEILLIKEELKKSLSKRKVDRATLMETPNKTATKVIYANKPISTNLSSTVPYAN